jgi:hypothetical protein
MTALPQKKSYMLTGEELKTASRHDIDMMRREMASKVVPKLEAAMKRAANPSVTYSKEVLDVALDALEMDLPPQLANDPIFQQGELDFIGTIIGGLTRFRLTPDGKAFVDGPKMKQLIAMMDVFGEYYREVLDLLEVRDDAESH